MRLCSQMTIEMLFQRDTAGKTCSRATVWPAYACAMCDFCLLISPDLMMPQFFKHHQVFVCMYYCLFGLGNDFTQDLQILPAWHRYWYVYIQAD